MPDAQGWGNDCFTSFAAASLRGSRICAPLAQNAIETAQLEKEVGDSLAS